MLNVKEYIKTVVNMALYKIPEVLLVVVSIGKMALVCYCEVDRGLLEIGRKL